MGYPNESKLRPNLLSIFNENYSSFQTRIFPALVLLLYFPTIFLTFDLFLSATPKQWKKSIGFSDPGLYGESFEKKSLKRSNIQEACQMLKIIDVTISSHIISFRFLGKRKSVDSK